MWRMAARWVCLCVCVCVCVCVLVCVCVSASVSVYMYMYIRAAYVLGHDLFIDMSYFYNDIATTLCV